MYFIFYSTIYTVLLLLFLLNGKIDLNIYAQSNIKDLNSQNIRDLANLYNNNNSGISPTSKSTYNNITILGTIDSSFSISENNYWVATGNWSMKVNDNFPIFDLNMTWHNNKQSTTRTYHIFNYKPTYFLTRSYPNDILFTNGASSISLNNQTESTVPITILIQKNKIMTLYYNDIVFNRHFGKQPLHGIVTLANFDNNLSSREDISTLDNNNSNIDQKTHDMKQQRQQYSLSKNNISLASNRNNTIDYNKGNQTMNLAKTTTTIIPSSNIITIPQNAAFIGNPSYLPSTIKINEGDKIVIVNKDNNYHTVTSVDAKSTDSLQLGRFFDSDVIYPHKMITIDTSKLKPGEYPFECSIHPFMKGTLIIG